MGGSTLSVRVAICPVQDCDVRWRIETMSCVRLYAMSELPVINGPGPVDNNSGGSCGSMGASAAVGRLPKWLKRQVPKGNMVGSTAKILEELNLETVCDNAKCPNRMECYSQQTATFMILGNTCTRPCGFCAVGRGKPEALELDEPARVAEAAMRLGLKHVVITSVTRDDLPDGGADHFYQCVLAVRERTGATVEVLTPDFVNNEAALERVVESVPEVFNHNTETCLLYTSPSPRDRQKSRMPSSA